MARGAAVDDRFEIEHLAGSGGMGRVYRARDRRTGQPVALKLQHPRASPLVDAAATAQFAHEIEVLAEVRHPAIVGHVAHGRTNAGEVWLAMEWLDGEDLAARLERGPLSIDETTALGRVVAEALGALHARGFVHRDIKPANLFLCGGRVERAKILDFGLARDTRVLGAAVRGAALMGTPAYMAPEQARGDDRLDARADVFSLGAVLFECLTGRSAFAADHVVAVLARILLDDAPRVRDLAPRVPEALDALVARMLAKDPAERPRDGAAVAAAITGAVREPAVAAPPSMRAPAALTAGEQRLLCVVMGAPEAVPLAATLTPEQAGVALLHLREAALPFGARLECLAGGAVVAVLAGTSAATDLAARAARCALAMRAAAPDLDLSLATGRGIVADRWPVGEVVDRAVALLHGAAPGGDPRAVRIDDVTAGLLSARFTVTAEDDALALRGEREDDVSPRTLLGKATPCIGRGPILDQLTGIVASAVHASASRAVVITAPPGVGKSRLLGEVLARLEGRAEPVTTWIARADAMSAGAPFGIVARALRAASGVIEGEPRSIAFRKLAARVRRHVPAGEAHRLAAFLGEAIGVEASDAAPASIRVQLAAARRDPRLLFDQVREAWEDLIAAVTQTTPLVILIDDLQWGDLPSVRLIEAALRRVADRPWTVLAFARPEVHDVFPGLWADRGVARVDLAPLSTDDAVALVRHVLGEAATAERARRLAELSAGNAFYLEELIRAAATGQGDHLPATVLAMAAARIEGLDPTARRVLRAASVFGMSFAEDGVAALLGADLSGPALGAVIADLVAREVIGPAGEAPTARRRRLAFRHALLCEAAYATLTAPDRALGHALAGAFLERAGEGDAVELAEHFERGGDVDRAVRWYRAAAEQAFAGNDLAAAVARADRAAACGASGETLGALRALAAEAHAWAGDTRAALSRGMEALALLARGTPAWCNAARVAALAAGRLGRMDLLDELVSDICTLGDGERPTADHLALWGALAGTLFVASSVARGAALVERIESFLGRMEAELDPVSIGHIDVARSWAAHYRGDAAAAAHWEEAALAAYERAGAVRDACHTRAGLGAAFRELGLGEEAERLLRDAASSAERLGLTAVRGGSLHNLGIVLAERGAVAEGLAVERAAVSIFEHTGNRRLVAATGYYLAQILALAGDLEAAETEARRAHEAAADQGPIEITALAVLASIQLARGRSAEALATAQRAVDDLATLGSPEEGEALLRRVHAEALLAQGRDDDARAASAAAWARILDRASTIGDPAFRARFLAMPEHARTLDLSRRWAG